MQATTRFSGHKPNGGMGGMAHHGDGPKTLVIKNECSWRTGMWWGGHDPNEHFHTFKRRAGFIPLRSAERMACLVWVRKSPSRPTNVIEVNP